MQLFVDDNQVQILPEWETMNDILYGSIKDILPEGRLIKKIDVNGNDYSELMADSDKSKAVILSEGDKIKIKTMSHEEMLDGSINSVILFFNEFKKGIDKTADSIRWGNYSGGFTDFAGYLTGLSVFIQIMDKIAQFTKLDYHNIIYKGKSVQAHFSDLEKILSSIMTTQKDADYTLLTDIIEFELKPNIDIWLGIMEEMKKNLKLQ
jgi:hypothetical protein